MPSTLTEKIDSREAWIGRAAAACTTTSAPSTNFPHRSGITHVAAELLDGRLERRIVERRDVQRPHRLAVGHQSPSEMEAEEARAAGDRHRHPGAACSESSRSSAGSRPSESRSAS